MRSTAQKLVYTFSFLWMWTLEPPISVPPIKIFPSLMFNFNDPMSILYVLNSPPLRIFLYLVFNSIAPKRKTLCTINSSFKLKLKLFLVNHIWLILSKLQVPLYTCQIQCLLKKSKSVISLQIVYNVSNREMTAPH